MIKIKIFNISILTNIMEPSSEVAGPTDCSPLQHSALLLAYIKR